MVSGSLFTLIIVSIILMVPFDKLVSFLLKGYCVFIYVIAIIKYYEL